MESAGCSPRTKGIMDIFELLVILAVIAMAPLLMKSMDWLDRYRDLKYKRLSEKLGKASDQIALQNGFGKLLAEPLSLSLVVKPDYPFFIYQNGIVLWPNRQQARIYHWHKRSRRAIVARSRCFTSLFSCCLMVFSTSGTGLA